VRRYYLTDIFVQSWRIPPLGTALQSFLRFFRI